MKLLLIALLAITATANTKSIFVDKKTPHCIKENGVTYVFTSPISDVVKGKSLKDITIECVDGKINKIKTKYNEW